MLVLLGIQKGFYGYAYCVHRVTFIGWEMSSMEGVIDFGHLNLQLPKFENSYSNSPNKHGYTAIYFWEKMHAACSY